MPAARGPKAARGKEALARLRREYGPRVPFLDHETPFQLLVAVVLSAQSTDKGVNAITPRLFAKHPTPHAMAKASVEELAALIKGVSYHNSKARHLHGLSRQVVERFGGEVPRTLEDLTSLPGVGRKTASVVQGYLHDAPESVAVDTHVRRVSKRLGLTRRDTPDAIADDLQEVFPRKDWAAVNWYLIAHGRAICVARAPRCPECLLADICPKVGVTVVGKPRG